MIGDAPVERVAAVVTAITRAFTREELDLSERRRAPAPGWQGMPELAVARRLRKEGMGPTELRCFLTFVAAMDRARDADRLWFSAASMWRNSPWVYDPEAVCTHSFTELSDALRVEGVSQRHSPDAAAWRTIAESLSDLDVATEIRTAVFDGRGDASKLVAALQRTSPRGTPLFPFLRGPKVGPMWVRMLVVPGGATISSLEVLPVAVDVQVRKVTENLGITLTNGLDLEQVRRRIQRPWHAGAEVGEADGPEPLAGTAAALDPAL